MEERRTVQLLSETDITRKINELAIAQKSSSAGVTSPKASQPAPETPRSMRRCIAFQRLCMKQKSEQLNLVLMREEMSNNKHRKRITELSAEVASLDGSLATATAMLHEEQNSGMLQRERNVLDGIQLMFRHNRQVRTLLADNRMAELKAWVAREEEYITQMEKTVRQNTAVDKVQSMMDELQHAL